MVDIPLNGLYMMTENKLSSVGKLGGCLEFRKAQWESSACLCNVNQLRKAEPRLPGGEVFS